MAQRDIPIVNNIFDMSRVQEMGHHALVGWLLDSSAKQERRPDSEMRPSN